MCLNKYIRMQSYSLELRLKFHTFLCRENCFPLRFVYDATITRNHPIEMERFKRQSKPDINAKLYIQDLIIGTYTYAELTFSLHL